MRSSEKVVDCLIRIRSEQRQFATWEVMEMSEVSRTSVRRVLRALRETGYLKKFNKRTYAHRVWLFTKKSELATAERLHDAYISWRRFVAVKSS